MKIVIVGGVAGGASAATRARRLSEDAEIVMIERGRDPSFANCGMPYYIGGQIKERDKLVVTTRERLAERYRLDVRTRQSVEAIDRGSKQVRIRELDTGHEYLESYDYLILAPGAAPLVPPTPGADLPGILTLRSLVDAEQIRAAALEAKSAVVVGGGFIGIEVVENLVHLGVVTTLVERGDQILPPWDAEMVAPLCASLRDRGVDLRLNDEIVSFVAGPQGGSPIVATLRSGESLHVDLVVMAIGVRPENQLATAAGLPVGPRGGIVVDEHQRTADPSIYAVGDAVQVTEFVTGTPGQVPLAGPANRQGRIAADHIFGRNSTYRGTQGTAIVGLFDRVAAMTGLSEKLCVRMDLPYEKVYLHPAHHAGYYPGAEGMSLKLIFDPQDGRVLGAQAVGGSGVDKRIDVIAMAIQGRMTVFDLEEVELAYAPQFGSAKDPVNMAGFIAAGVVRGDHDVVHADAVLSGDLSDAVLIDVRTPEEFAAGTIPGAINLSVDEIRDRQAEIPVGRPLVAFCRVGQRGYMATRLLALRGFQVANLSGGLATYTHHQMAHSAAQGGCRQPAVATR